MKQIIFCKIKREYNLPSKTNLVKGNHRRINDINHFSLDFLVREVLTAPKQKTTPTERTKKANKPQKTKRLNIDIDQLTFVKLKVISVKNDTTMTDIVSKLIKEYIDNYQGDI